MTFEDQIVRASFTGATTADVAEVSLPGMSAAMVQLTGTFVATTIFEVLVDEGSSPTWKAVSATNVTSGVAATTATAAGVYSVAVAGARRFRARCSAWTSGTVVVAVNVSRGSSGGGSSSGGGGGGASTIADGADVAEGTTTDAGVVTDTTGTVIGFLRGNIIKWIAQALLLGSVTEAAPASDTASSGLNGRLQRIAQRITSLIALLPASLGGKAAASSLAVTLATDEPLIGALTEAAPASDTASSGLNGRLQRIAQRITSLIALVPAALTGSGNFKVSITESTATVTTAGAKTNNNAAPGATNTGTLPSVANAAAPSWVEGNQVSNSVDLAGFQRGIVMGSSASGATAVGVNPLVGGMNGAGALVRFMTEANAAAATTGTGVLGVNSMVFDATNYQKCVGDTSGRQIIVGAAASGAALAGNPVLVAGSDGTNAVSLKIGTGSAAGLLGTYTAGSVTPADAAANSGFSGITGSAGSTSGITVAQTDFNGTTWDRHRNHVDATFLTSAARTTTQGPTNITTYNARAIYIVLDMTNVAAGPSVTLKVEMIDPASGKAIVLLTGAAVTTVTTNIYKIGVGLTAAANLVANEYLPRIIAVTVTANNANSGTYSVGYSLIAA